MTIAFLGSGIGSGHAVHAASVFFALKRAGIETRFILISDGEFGHLAAPYFECIRIRMQPHLFLKQDRESELYILLKNLDIDILITYGLWIPLFPILDDFSFKKIILFRQYEDWWFSLETKKHGKLVFDPAQYDQTDRSGFGLQIMAERAEGVGGSLEVDTAPGKGVRVLIWMPVTPGK
jgi:hypothetical protein